MLTLMTLYFVPIVLKEISAKAVAVNKFKLCVPNTIKNINVKVFNQMSRTNQTRHIE